MSRAQLTSTVEQNSGGAVAPYVAGKNFIINGGFDIDQRNSASSPVATVGSGAIGPDRFIGRTTSPATGTWGKSTSAPSGFTGSGVLTITATSSPSNTESNYIVQNIESINTAALKWGTSSAQPLTISFWAKSSVTGSFGFSVENNPETRSYGLLYSLPVANTWTYISLTIPGDTTGTWTYNTTDSMSVFWDMGVGPSNRITPGSWQSTRGRGVSGSVSLVNTNGATFYLTGVQAEVGSVATPFSRAGGTIQGELAVCQRYYYRFYPGANMAMGIAYAVNTTVAPAFISFPVTMRIAPTAIEQTGSAGDYAVRLVNTPIACSSVPVFDTATQQGALVDFTVASGLTAGTAGFVRTATSAAYLGWSAEF
jgi:hypothetical protein